MYLVRSAAEGAGLKALDMAYRLKGAYAPERHRNEAEPHIPAEALERVTRVLREAHEFERPGLTRDRAERLEHLAATPTRARGTVD